MNVFVRFHWLPLMTLTACLGVAGCEVSVGSGGNRYYDDDDSPYAGTDDTFTDGDADAGVPDADDDTDAGSDGDVGGGAGTSGEEMGTEDETSGDVPSVKLADLITAVAEAQCAAQQECVGEARLEARLLGADCVEQLAAALSEGALGQVAGAVESGALEYDSEEMAGCLDSLADLRCAVNVTRLGDLCADALRGAAAIGSPCTSHFECSGDAFCDYGSEELSCPGVCQPRSGEGEACSADDEVCAVGLLCVAGNCSAPAETGEVCSSQGPLCVLDHECVPKGDGENWCRPVGTVYSGVQDDSCSPDTTLCMTDLVCDRDALTCVPASASGAACTPGSLPEPCPADEFCDPESDTCTARLAVGQPCDPALAKQCAVGDYCIDDVCVTLGLSGDACETDGECLSNNCNLVRGACESTLICL